MKDQIHKQLEKILYTALYSAPILEVCTPAQRAELIETTDS